MYRASMHDTQEIMNDLSNSKIALVYDRVNKWGGAERVLLALHEIFPNAPLFTAVYDPVAAGWAQVFPQVISSFLQNFPLAKNHHEFYPWITPLAFETFRFDDYDIVISVTSADAKGIITKPNTFHLCYCLTPTRYLWSHADIYVSAKYGPLFNYLKHWDKIASHRPDAYIAISKTVQDRISKYYGLDSQVIYPPVEINSPNLEQPAHKDYFLWVGRLVTYKRIQIIVEVFNDLKLPLVIIGLGQLADTLRQKARENIYFLGWQSEEELSRYYQHARGLIFWHEEDFGLVPVEAMIHGTPVIGLNTGGVSETVIGGVTGYLIEDSQEQLKSAILNFNRAGFDSQVIKDHAQKFAKDRFKQEFSQALIRAYSGWRRRH